MSIIKYSSAGIKNHKNLTDTLRNSQEPTYTEIICWIMAWRLYAKINTYLAKFGNIFETLDCIKSTENLQDLVISEDQAKKYIDEIYGIGGKIIVPSSNEYPQTLMEIQDFPLVIYAQGNTALLHNRIFAIVGSRAASVDALQIAHNFARDLSASGITIISGFANGIDTAACNGALKYGTVQVLGSGLKALYPQTNAELYKKVLANNGLFISEFPPSFHAKPTNFPMRNRIITGLSDGVLIGQANKQNGTSGTLVTLRIALHQNKKIFACPGNILDEKSKICNDLIKNGTAYFTTSAQDIIAVINNSVSQDKTHKLEDIINDDIKVLQQENNIENLTTQIYNMLSTRPISINEITSTIGLSVTHVQEALTELELMGQVIVNHMGKYSKCLL